MPDPSHRTVFLLLSFFVQVFEAHNSEYSVLEALSVSCPERDSCAGYRFNKSYMDRNCECDNACASYRDCCIDATPRRRPSSGRSDIVCLNYGEGTHTGVYAVARCSSSWNGPQQVRQKCEGPPDLSDPMSAAPVTNVARSVTYKNLFCAECNNANMQSLQTFQFKLSCDGLDDISQAQIMGDLFYDQQRESWGVNRSSVGGGDPNFVECDVMFEVPSYVNSSVRFCRANVVSACASGWTRQAVRTRCEEDYMAVVYGDSLAYRNPHCALCNYKTVAQIVCSPSLSARRRPMSFAVLIDVNDGGGQPSCPAGHKYDPFFKKCKRQACALPGYVESNGGCVPDGS